MLPDLMPLLKPVDFLIEKWARRPRLRVEVARVHARQKHIFRTGFFESGLADLMAHDGTIDEHPGFANYLTRYTEVVVTRLSEAPVVVTAVSIRFADGGVRHVPTYRVRHDDWFACVTQMPTDLNFPHRLYISEDGFPDSPIVSVAVRDASGANHKSRHVRPASEIDADNEDVDGFRAWVLEALDAGVATKGSARVTR